jgi:hypothetical protein
MKNLNKKLQAQFDKMCQTGKLFRVALTGQQVWDLYLASFEDDPMFRDPESSTHNCNLCNNFIRRYGNVVAITEDYKIATIFDVEMSDEFTPVVKALSKALSEAPVAEVFFETFNELNSLPYESCSKSNSVFQLGMAKNVKRYTKEEAEKFGVVKANDVITFEHMHLFIPASFVDMSGKSVESIMADFRQAKDVFQRAMETISLDTLLLVKDLIIQGSLLDGQTHLYKIDQIIPLKKEYDDLSASVRDSWCWIKSYNLPFAKFRNELIGVLCSELSEGKEINTACQAWNKRVDPVNYMKTTAPITKKQIDEAKKFVEDNGYVESFDRRFASLQDIKVSEILHSNVGKDAIKSVSIFDGVKSTSSRHKRNEFDGVEEVTIEKFMKDILPSCTNIEVFLRNVHEGNMVSLTTANDPESKPIFKWDNNYSWTFNGNLAGKSQIKEAVKSQGGRVDGVLRFSIMWAEDNLDNSDLDAHCVEPDRHEIYYGDRTSYNTGGNLDIDITQPQEHKKRSGKEVVENITYPNLKKMKNGTYRFFVRQLSGRNSQGFKAEIEFNGEIFYYDYPRPVQGDIYVAVVTLKDGEFTINHELPETAGNKEIYGLETNQFHKVNLVCLSPNHWGENNTGNKHYMFMLDDCKAPHPIRSFHNENLNADLAAHRKVMEVLGTTNMITPSDKQLSGLGFNATVRDEVILKLSGTHKRTIKVKF